MPKASKTSLLILHRQWVRFVACFATTLILLSSTGVNAENELPTIGNSSSSLVSIEQERKLGQAWLRSLRGQVKLFDNPIVEDYLAHLVYSLAPNSNVLDRDFSLVIVDSQSLNAFAVPGSIVGINAGLFFYAISEQEFASVIAHELAHLGQRHYARQLERQQLSAPLKLAGILASVVIAATTGSDAGLAALASTQALSAEQQLSFSRQNEQEADRLGIATLYRSNYDPRAMPIMFERMFRQTRIQGEAIPEYLSTHPLSESRVSDTRNRATQYERQHYADNIEYHISKNIVATYYAESDRAAIDYFNSIIEKGNSTQIHAAKFGLAYASLKHAPKKAIELLNDLIKIYPNQISLQVTLADAIHHAGNSQVAVNTLKALLKRNPDNYPISDTLARIYLEMDQIMESEQLLKKLTRTQPLNPRIWYLLAEANGLAGNIDDLHLARAEFFFLTNRLDDAIQQLRFALKKSHQNPQQTALIQKRMDELFLIKKEAPF